MITSLIFIILSLIKNCISNNDLEIYEKLYIEGTALLQSNEVIKAIDILNDAKNYNSNHYAVYSNLGHAYHEINDFEKALESYKKSSELDNTNPTTFYNLGVIYHSLNNIDESIKSHELALTIDPLYYKSYYNLGCILLDQGDIDVALYLFEKVLEINTTHLDARLNICNILLIKDEIKAISCYRNILKLDPNHLRALQNLAGLLMSINTSKDEAILLLNKVLTIDPHSVIAKRSKAALEGSINSINMSTFDEENDISNYEEEATYAQSLFDSYAAIFDQSLKDLNYQVPKLIHSYLATWFRNEKIKKKEFQVLELGAGTGLVCPLIRQALSNSNSNSNQRNISPIVTITANDISSKMLARAPVGCYNDTIASDMRQLICDWTTNNDGDRKEKQLNIVVASDVFVYVGKLDFLSDLENLLDPGGIVIFTIELLVINEQQLQQEFLLADTGRYKHSQQYITRVAKDAGLQIKYMVEIMPRLNRGKEVKGMLVVLTPQSK